jgi:hypothetical protein
LGDGSAFSRDGSGYIYSGSNDDIKVKIINRLKADFVSEFLNTIDGISQCKFYGSPIIIDKSSTNNMISYKTKYNFANGEFNDFDMNIKLDCYLGAVSDFTKLHINVEYQTNGTFVMEGAFDADNFTPTPPGKGIY